MKEITVVIPNYNGIKFLQECLRSLMEQDGGTPEYEVIVVDNGSADGSLELMEREFPQVRVIALPENTGFCHAVNVGINASESPYVILLNNDTKVKTGFVLNLYDAIKSKPDAFSVSAKMLLWDRPELLDDAGDRYCVLGWAFARGKGRSADAYGEETEVFSACGGAAIYRRSMFQEIGLFDELHFAYLEDLDIGYRAKIHGYRNYYEPGAEVIHYGSASSGSRYNEFKTELAAANNIYVIGKNMPFLQWVWNLPFLITGFLIKFLFFCKKGMGGLYLKGLKKGFCRLFSAEGRKRRIRFQWSHLVNYFAIQWELYVNTLRFLKKY
ncbi:MAG: glycosyltransferase family 2 protein [Acetatifactor sp.]|nr:glycosyltransferase family 2 protein [Acetatifactor sp.]